MTNLALGQSRILAMIAAGTALTEVLDALLRFLEESIPGMLCSVLLLDPDGLHLHPFSAPSLSPDYSRAIDGAAIGPRAGSCGTAAWRKEQVIVTDIETDPLWADYLDLARAHGLRACWSTPVFDELEQVLGTFAMYFREPRSPQAVHRRIIEIALHVAAIAIVRERREQERLQSEAALRESEERYRLINLATKDAVWDWDLRNNTLWWNNGVETLFGYPLAEVPTDLQWWVDRVHPEDRERAHHSLTAAAEGNDSSWSEDYRFLRRNGSYADIHDRGYVMRDATGSTTRMIGMMQDISARKQAETRIRDLAYYEPLTRLPNRVSLQQHLAHGIAAARSGGHELALVLVNLNFFRDINDTLGHQNGDLMLQHAALCLRNLLSGSGQVAALGGDEFAILLPQHGGEAEVAAILHAVHDALQRPVLLAHIPIRIEATLGAALFPQHGTTLELLWQHADVALRTAKERHEPHLFYSPAIDHYDPARLALLGELGDAIDRDELVLHYQPKIDLRRGCASGIEALVRWQHPVRGLLYPDSFLPLAERTGLINPLTAWVVKHALQTGLRLLEDGYALDLAINLSARNLHDPAFCTDLLAQISADSFPVARLILEVTETAIMADPQRARAVLAELQAAGIHLAMDDFGTGHSSLAYLKDLPIDQLKIDKSFVMGFAEPRNAAIVRSMIDLARNLDLRLTAEGVEDAAACRALGDMGCDLGQGYFFSKPLAIGDLERWLRESPWKAQDRNS